MQEEFNYENKWDINAYIFTSVTIRNWYNGKGSQKICRLLDKAGQTYWQILPICPTSYGDSPYQSFSSFAGNPYFIDLDYLCKDKLLTKKECLSYEWGENPEFVEYGTLYENRFPLLKKHISALKSITG